MASVTTEKRNGKSYFRVLYRDHQGRWRKIRLGQMSRRDAQSVCLKIEAIVSAQVAGNELPLSVSEWLAGINDEFHAKLADSGLVKPRINYTLENWIAEYLSRHLPGVGFHCQRNLERSRDYALEFFGKDKPLKSITVDDAKSYRSWLVQTKGLAQATVAQHIKKIKQYFLAAVKAGAVHRSPFADVVTGSMRNDLRSVYVPVDSVNRAIEFAPDAQWRLIIALCRYAGLRCPSEVLALRWSDVDFVAGTLSVRCTKTLRHGKTWRTVPILPELRPHLEDAFKPDDERCISRYQTSNLNLRKVFLEILQKADVEPWPRLFHNLRGSLQTDLADKFPIHVVTAWIGNSRRVAEDHYLKVTPEHLASAQGVGTQVGQTLQETTPLSGNERKADSRKTRKSAIPLVSQGQISTFGRTHTHQRIAGSNERGGNTGGTSLAKTGGILAQDSATKQADLTQAEAELLTLFRCLDSEGQREALEAVRDRAGIGVSDGVKVGDGERSGR